MRSFEELRTELGDGTSIRVPRDGERDIRFHGWLLGEGSHGTGGGSGFASDWNRGVNVKIFLTVGGTYVAHVKRWSLRAGEGIRHNAYICSAVMDLLNALVADSGGTLGPASKEAWEVAAEVWEPLAEQECEEIE